MSFFIVVGYLTLCLAFFLLQNHELFPGRATQGQAYAMVRPSPEYELVHFTDSEGDAIVALFGHGLGPDGREIPNAAALPTMLYFYGNSMSMADSFEEFSRFRGLGFNVMIPDYPGYGMSGGRASENAFYSCAEAAYDKLQQRNDVDPRQIFCAGWSMGAAVATELATQRPVMALATFSGFSSCAATFRFCLFPYSSARALTTRRNLPG